MDIWDELFYSLYHTSEIILVPDSLFAKYDLCNFPKRAVRAAVSWNSPFPAGASVL